MRQAQFIKSLQTEQSQTNIWKSVLMIEKMGTLQPKMNKIRGIIDSAKKNGAGLVYLNEDAVMDHVVGFKCIDLIQLKGSDAMYDALVSMGSSKQQLMELGYVTKKEMKEIIQARLDKLDCFMLDYQDKICEKCSLRGDPRYLHYKCHCLPIPKHPKGLIAYHPKPLEEYHPLGTHIIHPGEVIHIHPRHLETYHPAELIEMEVDDEDNPVFYHSGIQ